MMCNNISYIKKCIMMQEVILGKSGVAEKLKQSRIEILKLCRYNYGRQGDGSFVLVKPR